MRQQYALLGKRIGSRSETSAAIAEVTADIEPGPVVDGFGDGRLERHIGRGRRPTQRECAERHTSQEKPRIMLLISAVAVHRADISQRLRRSRVITADLKACRHPRNEVINPAAPGRIFMILPVQARPGERAAHGWFLLQVIRNSNKTKQRTRWMAAVDDSFATRRAFRRTQPAKKVDPPGRTIGRPGLRRSCRGLLICRQTAAWRTRME